MNKMNKDPSLRCSAPEACLAKVKEGSTVYSSVSIISYCLRACFYIVVDKWPAVHLFNELLLYFRIWKPSKQSLVKNSR